MAQTYKENQFIAMRNSLPRIVVDGDTDKARAYIGPALSQMRILDNAMSFQNLKQGVRRVWLSPDVYVECSRVFYNKQCRIWARPVTQSIIQKTFLSSGIFLAYGYYEKDENSNFQMALADSNLKPGEVNRSYMYSWPLTTSSNEISFTYDIVTVIITKRYNRIYYDLSTYYSAQVIYNGNLIEASHDFNVIYGSNERSWIDFGVTNNSPSFGCDIELITETKGGVEESFYSVSLCGTPRDTRLIQTTPNKQRRVYNFDIKLDGGKFKLMNTTNRVYNLPDDNSYVLLGCRITNDGTEVIYHKNVSTEALSEDFITIYNAKYNSWRDDKKIAEFNRTIIGARLSDPEAAVETWPPESENISQGTQVKKILWNFFKKEAVYILSESMSASFKHEVSTENPKYINFATGTNRGFHSFYSSYFGAYPSGESPSVTWPPEAVADQVESNVVIAEAKTNVILPDYFIGDVVLDGGTILYKDTEYGMCDVVMPYSKVAGNPLYNYWYADILWYDKGERVVYANSPVDYSFDKAVVDISGYGLCVAGQTTSFKAREAEQIIYNDYAGIISGEIDWARIGERDYKRHPWQVNVVDSEGELFIENSPIEKVSLSKTFPYTTYVKAVLLHTLNNAIPPAIVYAREEYDTDGITIKSDGIRGREFYMIDANGVKTDVGKNIKTGEETTNSQWERAFFFQIKN